MSEDAAHDSGVIDAESRDLIALRRSDLAAALAVYRRESSGSSGLFWLIFGFTGFLAAIGISALAERRHWSEAWGPVVLVAMWIPMLTALVVLTRRERKLRARLQLFCPACNAPFLDGGLTRGLSRADLAVASGCCQDCGAEVLARDV